MPPAPQAGGDVVDVLGGLADPVPVGAVTLVSQDWGRDIVHVLWNGRLVVVKEMVVGVLAGGGGDWLEFGKVRWHVVGLLSDWMSIRDIFTDRGGEVIDLKGEREKYFIVIKMLRFVNTQHQGVLLLPASTTEIQRERPNVTFKML